MYADLKYFPTFSLFAPRFKENKHHTILWNGFKYISFKIVGINEMYRLIQNQEQVLSEKYGTAFDSHIKNFEDFEYKDEPIQIAYLDAFLSAVYALTENIAKITKVFYDELPFGFNKQRERLIKNININNELSVLMQSQEWYDLFHEIRTESTHFGSGYLIWDNGGIKPRNASSRLIISAQNKKQNKIVVGEPYVFDFKNINLIRAGVLTYLENWSSVMIKQLDPEIEQYIDIADESGIIKESKKMKLKEVLTQMPDIKFYNRVIK